MKKSRNIELMERALHLLGVSNIYDKEKIKQNFRRQMKLINSDKSQLLNKQNTKYNNSDICCLLIQAYGFLSKQNCPTTMLEDDELVGILLNGNIVPMDQTITEDKWNLMQFYNQFSKSIWPDCLTYQHELKYKFRGIC